MQLSGFDVASFLRGAWQQRPLLIRNPWDLWENPLEPDELAGLACEDGVEARLITHGPGRLAVEHGLFAESRFGELGSDPWTLLVQAVDHHVPAVADLLVPFRFIPNWRVDDVMVSYAVDGGGVGAHFDHYDVFLIQGLGTRRWQLGARCDEHTELLPHDDLRLLANFTATEEWVLEPGDILYVPPGVAHNGVAVGDDCMTYSIGFRAPSRRELIEGWTAHLLEDLSEDDRYADPRLALQDNPGEITGDALDRLHRMVTAKLLDRGAFTRWFGRYNSAPKNPDIDWSPEHPIRADELRSLATGALAIMRNPASRFSFVRQADDAILLFVDGECFTCEGCAAALAEQLCASERFTIEPGTLSAEPALALALALLNQGAMALDDD